MAFRPIDPNQPIKPLNPTVNSYMGAPNTTGMGMGAAPRPTNQMQGVMGMNPEILRQVLGLGVLSGKIKQDQAEYFEDRFLPKAPTLEEMKFASEQEVLKKEEAEGKKSKNKGVQDLLANVGKLLSMDTDPITGTFRFGGTKLDLRGKGAKQKGLHDKLIAMLSLEGREKIKGTGAISDYETKMLEKAASSINAQMSNQDYRNALIELEQGFKNRDNDSGLIPQIGGSQVSQNDDILGLFQ